MQKNQLYKNNIKTLLHKFGKKQKDLMFVLDLSESKISNIVNGWVKIDHATKIKIADFLTCDPSEIIYECEQSSKIHTTGRDGDFISSQQVTNTENTLSIPLYDIKASAGKGIVNYSDDVQLNIGIEYFIETTGIMIRENDVKNKRFCLMWARGDSMYNKEYEASIKDGDLLLLDLSVKRIETYKQIIVFRDQEQNLYIKQVFIPKMGHFTVKSFNSEYESWIDITKEELTKAFGEMEIIGRVVWSGSRMGF
jgi:phage repressor protein C with HTH and peptisase S24 domain/DNA-binding Xre family transcriptional regulator